MAKVDRPASRGLGWLGLVLALGAPVAVVALAHSGLIDPTLMARRSVSWIGLWAVTLTVLAMVVWGERRPLVSIGLGGLTAWSLGWGLVAGLLAILAFPVSALILEMFGVQSLTAIRGAAALGALPLWARLATLATAGICEEVLFRGYAITRLRELTGSRALAVIVPAVVFVGLHAPSWGLAHLLYAAIVAVIMTVLFLWRGDLWSNIFAHLFADAVPLVLLPLLAPQ